MLEIRHEIAPIWRTGMTLTLEEFVNEYRKIYQLGQAFFDKHNPCQVVDGVCYRARTKIGVNFCCSGPDCKYLGENGCQAEALWCKVWACQAIRGEAMFAKATMAPEVIEELNILRDRASAIIYSGRKDLSDYIRHFFGEEALKEWKISETSSQTICAASAS